MSNIIDKRYFQELEEQEPQDICKRSICKFDPDKKSYVLSVWNDTYSVSPHECKIERITGNSSIPHEYLNLFIIYYLLNAKEIEISNEWISEKDIPGGVGFFRGPHEIPTRLISERFANDTGSFKKQCELLNGTSLSMADVAFSFKIAPRIPIALLYWRGDDEFPPEAKILYDRTISRHLTHDIIFALAVSVCEIISNPGAGKTNTF